MALKAAGYDAVFFTGIADKPVYLYLEDGRAELCDAGHLWGKDCYEIQDWVKSEIGQDAEAACIGPAGEQLSLISAIIHAKGRAAGRSGVGAVMGAKRLKAVVARGSQSLPLADPTVAFAFECFEHGLITTADTGGLELRWSDHKAIIAMAEKLARREDFGDVIADGGDLDKQALV